MASDPEMLRLIRALIALVAGVAALVLNNILDYHPGGCPAC
jgi:hypothetical protein